MTDLCDKEGFIWFDGKMVDWKDAQLHFLTHGLHYASSVFEGCRAYNGKIFKLKEHSERLIKSAEILDIKVDFDADYVSKACQEVLDKNNLKDAYVRPVIWLGSQNLGVYSRDCKTMFAVAVWEWPSYFGADIWEKGISLCWAKYKRPAPDTAPTAAKAAGLYMIGSVEKNRSHDLGFTDALMLDYRGYVAECTGANIFFVKGNEIRTPIADCFLNGITRQTVIELAKQAGYDVKEVRIMPEDLKHAEEVFVTGTAAEITPVGKIDTIEYKVGPATKKLHEIYSKAVRS